MLEPFEDVLSRLQQLLRLADKIFIGDLVALELLNLDSHRIFVFLLQDFFKLILSLVVDRDDVFLSLLENLREQLWLVGLLKDAGDDLEEVFNALILRVDDLVEELELILFLHAALLSADNIAPFLPYFYVNSVVFGSAQLFPMFGNFFVRICDERVKCFSLATALLGFAG